MSSPLHRELLGQPSSQSSGSISAKTLDSTKKNLASLGKEGVMNPNDIDRAAIQMRHIGMAQLIVYL